MVVVEVAAFPGADAINPLIPTGYDIVWLIVALLIFALTVVTLILLARMSSRLSILHIVVWAVVILCVPVLGALVWLTVGRPDDARYGSGSV